MFPWCWGMQSVHARASYCFNRSPVNIVFSPKPIADIETPRICGEKINPRMRTGIKPRKDRTLHMIMIGLCTSRESKLPDVLGKKQDCEHTFYLRFLRLYMTFLSLNTRTEFVSSGLEHQRTIGIYTQHIYQISSDLQIYELIWKGKSIHVSNYDLTRQTRRLL